VLSVLGNEGCVALSTSNSKKVGWKGNGILSRVLVQIN
jgi:hypothetical protein